VVIYNWVRNNIQFVPSYGSIQGSDMTLQTKRGNSFDTASLLIALLRAANVPARYVYGTIEVPADKAMNWVGGVTVPQAAQNLMGQGGIPNIGSGARRASEVNPPGAHVGGGVRGLQPQPWRGQQKSQHLGADGCELQAIPVYAGNGREDKCAFRR